jgi:hypothetical protein
VKNHIALTLIGAALLGMAPLSPAATQEDKTTAKEVRQEMSDTADSIKNYTIEQRDEAAKKAKAGLAALDARINALEARIDKDWDKMDKAARVKARSTLNALHQQRIAAAEWYGGLKNSTAEAWDDMKRGFSDAYQSLLHASEKADRENRKH